MKTLTNNTRTEKIENFFSKLDTTLQINDNLINYFDDDDFDQDDAFNSIYGMIDEKGGFDIEVIYYATAMQYLMENDNSLRESLELAHEFGFETDKINSELLASLLKSQNVREDFNDYKTEIEDFFSELETEEEN